MDIKQQVIVVTGAGQGLGRAISVELARHGAIIAAVDLNEEKLQETIAQCKAVGGDGKAYLANVAKEDSVMGLCDAIAHDFKSIAGLVNNAGILRDGLLIKVKEGVLQGKLSLQDWQSVIDVNLTGVFLCTREIASRIALQKTPGVIVNISSVSRAGNVGQSNYTAAKAGVAAMTVSWAKELARYNIRVGAIAPGFIATDMTSGMRPDALEKMLAQIPLHRMGTPEEIAHSVLYIFENDYFTGRVIECDGGIRI